MLYFDRSEKNPLSMRNGDKAGFEPNVNKRKNIFVHRI